MASQISACLLKFWCLSWLLLDFPRKSHSEQTTGLIWSQNTENSHKSDSFPSTFDKSTEFLYENMQQNVLRRKPVKWDSARRVTWPVRGRDKAKEFSRFFAKIKRSTSYLFPSEKGDKSFSEQPVHSWVSLDRILIVELGVPITTVQLSQFLSDLKVALSNLLLLPTDSVTIYNIHIRMNSVEVVFRDTESTTKNLNNFNLLRVTDVIYPTLDTDIQRTFPTLNITGVYPASFLMGIVTDVPARVTDVPFWLRPYFAYIVSASVVFALFAVGLAIYCCLRLKLRGYKLTNLSNITLSSNIDPLKKSTLPSQLCVYPNFAPQTTSPSPVQPDSDAGYNTGDIALSGMGRLRGKGLLERRGSNASLTIDINSSPELTPRWEGTPPKESSVLEYLQSAGNRLSRLNLQETVHNVVEMYEEFWEIPTNLPEKVYVAGSGTKNRYKSIIPNEHSRVLLSCADQDPLSVYMNANYIRGYEGRPRAYIATQGPMAHTISDFWAMVWQENIPLIVMITKLRENHKVKCENYLPETVAIYGDITVAIDNIENKPGYTIRHMTLQNGTESQSVVHFWYTDWPDHKPPDCARSLLNMIQEVDTYCNRLTDHTHQIPTLLHCSAGVGRSGCYIAINTGMQQLREDKCVDIMGLVCAMRIDRGGMVQTSEQYVFIHQALALYDREYLHNGEKVQSDEG